MQASRCNVVIPYDNWDNDCQIWRFQDHDQIYKNRLNFIKKIPGLVVNKSGSY